MTQPITQDQLRILMSDLNRNRVKSRSQAGRSFSYLEGWDVKATLIRVFGFGGFSAEVLNNHIVDQREVEVGQQKKPGWQVSILSTVRLTIHQTGAVYTETAIATSSQPSLGDAMDMAIKSASTDALKRAATYLGTQFGLSLYADGATREVISRVFAPGQAWPLEQAEKAGQPVISEDQQKVLEDSLGAQSIEPNVDHTETVQA